MTTSHRTHPDSHLTEALPDEAPAKLAPSMMGKLFVAILLVAVFEGAIRKWISTGFTVPLVLLRDCLAFYGLFWAIKNGKINADQMGAQTLWWWSTLVVLWGMGQLMVNQSSPLVYMVGIRFWLLYLWFAYAAAVSLTADDLRYITKTILWLLLAMVPLAVVQFYLPPSDFLNKQLDDSEISVFLVTAGIVRATGTFSFALGYSTFLAIANPFVFALLASGKSLGIKKWMSYVLVIALAVATIVSGSRSALLQFGIMLVVYIIVTLRFSKAGKNDSTMFGLLAMLLIFITVSYVFFSAVDAIEERFVEAAESEVFSERVTTIFLGDFGAYEKFSLIGSGVGAGNNFASVETTGERNFLLGETEAERTILEGGLIGFIFIGLKLIVIFIGLKQSLRIVKSSGDGLPLMLWLTLSIGLMTWSIIGQLTVNVFGYLLLGLGIASLRLADEQFINELIN